MAFKRQKIHGGGGKLMCKETVKRCTLYLCIYYKTLFIHKKDKMNKVTISSGSIQNEFKEKEIRNQCKNHHLLLNKSSIESNNKPLPNFI